jgi:hypothetical protein
MIDLASLVMVLGGVSSLLCVIFYFMYQQGVSAEKLHQERKNYEVANVQKQAAVNRPDDIELDDKLRDGKF